MNDEKWIQLHHADTKLESSPAEAIIFWCAVGFWVWFFLYYLVEWMTT